MRNPILAAGLLAATASAVSAQAQEQTPQLRVLTYDSFVSDWGPGPQIETAFEAICNCDLVFEASGDAAAMLSRLMLEGARSSIDVVLGLDTNLTAQAGEMFVPHGVSAELDLPIAWDDPLFLPFDWGWFAFVHDTTRLPDPPASFQELIESDLSVVIQDPRSSTPGLGLLMWVKAAYGDEAAAIWQGLAPRILTVTPGWSEAYGLFLEGEADMVLSYTTSPAYHLIAEGDDSKAAAPFAEGHYLQIEVGGILASSAQTDLARDFMDFMVSEGFQSVIPETNWMYPAVLPEAGLAEGFDQLIRPETSLLLPPAQAQALRDEALSEWRNALSQ